MAEELLFAAPAAPGVTEERRDDGWHGGWWVEGGVMG